MILGTFALFIVIILHLKKLDYRRNQQNYENSGIINSSVSFVLDEGVVQQNANVANMQFIKIWNEYYQARELNVGWSYNIGVIGVMVSVITSVLWIIMAKILRYTTVGVSI